MRSDLQHRLAAWYAANARMLPWREAGTTPWGVLVSEIMAQQTPVVRVEKPWRDWLERWPSPADLAAASVADVLRAWGILGYPRRALRLRQTAEIILAEHDNCVPDDEVALRALPGVGRYTAAAVLAFAYGRRSLVLDTNVRRVLARLDGGVEYASASETADERRRAWAWVPDGDAEAALWSVSVMELGAVVCTAKSPGCERCPLLEECAWFAAGCPRWPGKPRVAQSWDGTDRQCRGCIMAVLRGASGSVSPVDVVWHDAVQLSRCIEALVADGLAVWHGDHLALPA